MTKSIFSDRYRRFCQLLIKARTDKKLSQSDLAARIGKPQSFVSKFERGERRLDVVEFLDLADTLQISVEDVLSHLRGPTIKGEVQVVADHRDTDAEG